MTFRRKAMLVATVSSLAFVASPAQSATFMNIGDSALIAFNGIVEGSVIAGLTGTVEYTLVNKDSDSFFFDFTVTNTSSDPITASRISTFGFNTTPDIVSAAITGGTVFDGVSSGNVPQLGNIEFCATAGPNCAGGSGEGVELGDSASGQFSLNFAALPTSVDFEDFYVRYQSIDSPTLGFDGDSGVGVLVPEPATWGMMILGIGMIGGLMRRRRQTVRYHFI